MLCREGDLKVSMRDGVSIKELQETLGAGKDIDVMMTEEEVLEKLSVLEERLMRVRSWGGSYSEVEFSPDVRAILDSRRNNIRRRTVPS